MDCYSVHSPRSSLTLDLKTRNANTVGSYPLAEYLKYQSEPLEFSSHVSEEIARDPVMRHVLDECRQYLGSVEEMHEQIDTLELDEQEQQDADLLSRARDQGMDGVEAFEYEHRPRSRSKSRSRSNSRSRSRSRSRAEKAEESSESHSVNESEESVSNNLEHIFRHLPVSYRDVDRVALVRTVEVSVKR